MNTVGQLCFRSKMIKNEILKGMTDNTDRYDLLLLLSLTVQTRLDGGQVNQPRH